MRILLLVLMVVVYSCGPSQKSPLVDPLVMDAMAKKEFDGYTLAKITLDKGGSCSGTLVAKNVIVTAAHCFDNPKAEPVDVSLHSKIGSQYGLKVEKWKEGVGYNEYDAFGAVFRRLVYNDFAYIVLKGKVSEKFPFIEIASNLTPGLKAGISLSLFGFTSNQFHKLSTKVAADPFGVGDPSMYNTVMPLDNDLTLQGGDSGGPCLFLQDGKKAYLAGVISGTNDSLFSADASSLCIAVKPFVSQIETEAGVKLKTAGVP